MSVTIYAMTGVIIFALSLYSLLVYGHLLRRILAVNIMGTSTFLVLIAMAGRDPTLPPDPVPQAMVLTGIVVAVSATALALSLARHIHSETGETSLPGDVFPEEGDVEDVGERGEANQ
ncbi:MAG: sodium:proton antiporter [Bradymonadaceae bacterium]